MSLDSSMYEVMNLSEFNVVKLLIQFRDKYDQYFLMENSNYYDVAGETNSFNTSMIHTFLYLDELIERCKFNSEQKIIINMIQKGYTYREIARAIKKDSVDNVRRRFNKICRDIVKMNDRLWKKYTFINKLELKTKKCSKCKEELPAIDDFFSPDDRNNDGFHSFCKFCR